MLVFTPVGNYSLDFGQKSIQFIFDEDYGATDEEIPNILPLTTSIKFFAWFPY
jgi:hypothetical protein